MKHTGCLRFAVIVSMLLCIQMALAVSSSAKAVSQRQAKPKKAPPRKLEYSCATPSFPWVINADSELRLEPEAADAILGQVVHKVYPRYPAQAVASRVEGDIIVEAIVS